MENFVLYDELGKGEHSVIYKGRRKGTITFLAIHCIEKCKRAQITNRVRLTNELEHKNIVSFYEWYETTNHLWLVVELCTGGSLESIIQQDVHLPESSIELFGLNLVEGLFHIHSSGILFCDIRPSKILLDGPGVLKYSDFSLARVQGENLQNLYEQFLEADEADDVEEDLEYKTMGSPVYTAPEVLQGAEHGIASDMWALGCVLYELFMGKPPFQADDFDTLIDNILHKPYPPPKVKGSRISSKPTPDYLDLISALLDKDPEKRASWHVLLCHPFWKGQLSHLVPSKAANEESPLTGRKSHLSSRSSLLLEHSPSSVLGHIKDVNIRKSSDFGDLSGSGLKESFRPKSAMAQDGQTVPMFTLSSRPSTAQPSESIALASPSKHAHPPPGCAVNASIDGSDVGDSKDTNCLIYHSCDFQASNIVDNPKIMKPLSVKFDNKALIVPPYSVTKILSLESKESHKHISTILDVLANPEKGPPTQKRIHLLNYATTLVCNAQLANLFVQCDACRIMAKQIKEVAHFEHRTKLSRCLGLVVQNSDELSEDVNLSEAIAMMSDVLRDTFRNSKVKQSLLATVGEMILLVARQGDNMDSVNLTVPSVVYTLIIRCLREGEDAVVNHYAAKIIENVAITRGSHQQKFTTNEVGQMLWYIFTHSNIDSLRITAVSALCRLARYNTALFPHVVEKVGLSKVLPGLSVNLTRVQQAMLTLFASYIKHSRSQATRLTQDKEFVSQVVRLLESPSPLIRAKVFVALIETINCNREMLLHACQLRLVMYIERDRHHQTPRDQQTHHRHSLEYLSQCIDALVHTITNIVPLAMDNIVSCLEVVAGRKHPSVNQTKQLKVSLPLIPVLLYCCTSQVFRPIILNEQFLVNVGILLKHVKAIETGETNIESATGTEGTMEFTSTTLAIIESLVQHPVIITEHGAVFVEHILPSLTALLASDNGDTKAKSLCLVIEVATTLLSEGNLEVTQRYDPALLHILLARDVFPQYEQLLLDPDPLPSFVLQLLQTLLEHDSAYYIKQLEEHNLLAVIFQVLRDHESNPCCATMQYIVNILNYYVTNKDSNMKELYDLGFVESLTHLFPAVSTICLQYKDEQSGPCKMLLILMTTLHSILKYLSDVVRKALQAKKKSATDGSTEAGQAEKLLLLNKPLSNLTNILSQLLTYEDHDIADLSCKCLSLVVQLFGGEHPDAMSATNMERYSEALRHSDIKKQKILLRIIKRLVATDKHNTQMLSGENGQVLRDTLNSLVHTASSHADVQLSSMVADILKTTL